MSKLVTNVTLKLLCRALKAFHMGAKTLLVITWHLLIFITSILVTWLSWLDKWLFLLVFSLWKLCVLVLHQIDLHSLWVTSHLFDILAVAFELSIFFASCLILLAGNFSTSMLPSFMVLDTSSSSHKKNQKISQCRILAVSGGYLARLTCICTALYHSSTFLLLCLKLVRRSKWALTSFDCGLQNSSNFPQILSKLSSSADMHQDTYWSIQKSLLQAVTFLHFCHSGSAASSHSRMFLHFKCHFKNPIHLGTFYVWHEHVWYYLFDLDGWEETSGSGSWSELDTSSWLLGTSLSSWDKLLFPWAELLVVLDIMGLLLLDFRTLPINTDTLFLNKL